MSELQTGSDDLALPSHPGVAGSWRAPRIPNVLAVGVILLASIAVAVYLVPLILPHDPIAHDLDHRFEPPNRRHFLGTDNFGRDILARILYAGRIDLQVGIIATFFSFLIGSVVGVVAGFYGRWVDSLVMRIADVLMAFPNMVLVIGIVAMLGPGIRNMYIAIIVPSWIAYARLVRGETIVVKNLEYIQAAKVIGCGNWDIIWRHFRPNVVAPAIIFGVADVLLNILFAASLGYLGLGVQPPNPEWGAMVAEGRSFIAMAPGMTVYPGLAIISTGIACSLIGDGLADYLRPGG